MKAKTALQVASLCTVPFIMVLGNSMLIPVLPGMGAALGLTKLEQSFAITAFSVSAGLAIPLSGYLSDRFGRKAVIVPGLLLYALGGVLAGFVGLLRGAYWLLLVGRVTQGVGASGTAPIAMALVGDTFQSKERAKVLGLIEASNGIGKVLSPIFGSLIGLIAWWAVFFGYVTIAVPSILLVMFIVKEPKGKRNKEGLGKYLASVGLIFKEKGLSLVAAIWSGTVVLFVLFGVLFYLSELLEDNYGIDGLPKGLILAVPLLVMASMSYLTGGLLQRKMHYCKGAILLGFGLGIAGLVAAALIGYDWAYYAGIIINGIGTGLVLTSLNNLITSAAGKEERGAISAVYGAVRFFGVAFGPPIFTFVMTFGRAAPYWFTAALEGFTFLLAWWLIKPKRLLGGGDSPTRFEPVPYDLVSRPRPPA